MPAGNLKRMVELLFVEVVGRLAALEHFPAALVAMRDVLDVGTVEGADALEDVAFFVGAEAVGFGLVQRHADSGEALVKIG